VSRNRLAPSVALAFPALVLLAVLGCPKGKGSSDAGAPAASSVATAASTSASGSAWPKTVVVEDPEADATIDAIDAELDAMDDSDALDSDARDAKPDAAEDVPLMGTKTYPDETPARGIRKITSNAAKVHKAPKDGTAITSLQKGTEVSLVAEYMDWYRIRYTDPVTTQRRQGWIYIINMIGPRMKTCPVDWTHHDQEGGWCDRECTKNTDCKALKGFKCSGTRCFYAGD